MVQIKCCDGITKKNTAFHSWVLGFVKRIQLELSILGRVWTLAEKPAWTIVLILFKGSIVMPGNDRAAWAVPQYYERRKGHLENKLEAKEWRICRLANELWSFTGSWIMIFTQAVENHWEWENDASDFWPEVVSKKNWNGEPMTITKAKDNKSLI